MHEELEQLEQDLGQSLGLMTPKILSVEPPQWRFDSSATKTNSGRSGLVHRSYFAKRALEGRIRDSHDSPLLFIAIFPQSFSVRPEGVFASIHLYLRYKL